MDEQERRYTNTDLARDYIAVISQRGISDAYVFQKRLIAGSDVDIYSFYQDHGSLETLKARGIGMKTKAVLELILKEGAAKAAEIFLKEQEEGLKRVWTWRKAKTQGGKVFTGQRIWSDSGK